MKLAHVLAGAPFTALHGGSMCRCSVEPHEQTAKLMNLPNIDVPGAGAWQHLALSMWELIQVLSFLAGALGHGALTKPLPRLVSGRTSSSRQ